MLSAETKATTECHRDVGKRLLRIDSLHLVGVIGGVGAVFRCQICGNGRLNGNDFCVQIYVWRDEATPTRILLRRRNIAMRSDNFGIGSTR